LLYCLAFSLYDPAWLDLGKTRSGKRGGENYDMLEGIVPVMVI
jgi:hypothetical protein